MKFQVRGCLGLLAAIVLAGCASTKVGDRQVLVDEKISRPDRILVYDFAATHESVPSESSLTGHLSEPSVPQTPEQARVGRQLGAHIANALAAEINAMGMTAEAVRIATPVPVGDIVIKGYLVSAEAGSEEERLVVGFGKGASELSTVVEGFQMTPQGLRKLGGGTVHSGGSSSPGAALGVVGLIATHNPVGLIVSTGMKLHAEQTGSATLEGRAKATAKEISDALEPRFQQQGWIQ